jgi:hypothetical protein
MKNLNRKDKLKISNRYNSKIEEFNLKTLDELKELYANKMSSTDRYALIHVVDKKLQQKRLEELKQDDNIEKE